MNEDMYDYDPYDDDDDRIDGVGFAQPGTALRAASSQ